MDGVERAIPIVALTAFMAAVILLAPDLFRLQDMITGYATLDTTVLIMNVTPNLCNTSFHSGWNLISIPCLNATTPIGMVVAPINGSLRSMHQYIGDAVSDNWKAYNPGLPAWVVQDLTHIDRRKGYWLFMEDSRDYVLEGNTVSPNLVVMQSGWNMIGYPTLEKRDVALATSSLVPNFEYFYLYNASDPADLYKEYSWNLSLPTSQDLNQTVPYHGYWVYMYSPQTWVVTW